MPACLRSVNWGRQAAERRWYAGQQLQTHCVPSVDINTSPAATMRSALALSRPSLPSGSAGLVNTRRGAGAKLQGKAPSLGWQRW